MLPVRDEFRARRLPAVTYLLIAANLAVFVLVQPAAFRDLLPSRERNVVEADYLYEHALVPCELVHGEPLSPPLEASCTGTGSSTGGTAAFFPHKDVYVAVVVSMFLHANWLHVLGNLWFLWVFGDNVEDRLGPLRYLALYLIGGVVASLGQVAGSPESIAPTLGASGAIAAVLGAHLVLLPRTRVLAVIPPLVFLPFAVPAWLLLGSWFVLQFFTNPSSGVAWLAHVTGFAFGVVTVLAARRNVRASP